MTANVFLERTFDEALTPEDVLEGGRESAWCFDLHRVRWHGSFLSLDGRALVCRFSAPDMESARLALRDPDMDLSRLWAGTVHKAPQGGNPNVVVERSFDAPLTSPDGEGARTRHDLVAGEEDERPDVRVEQSEFLWLDTNIAWKSGEDGEPLVAADNLFPTVIRESGGVTVGIFGLTTDLKHPQYVESFGDPVAVVVARPNSTIPAL